MDSSVLQSEGLALLPSPPLDYPCGETKHDVYTSRIMSRFVGQEAGCCCGLGGGGGEICSCLPLPSPLPHLNLFNQKVMLVPQELIFWDLWFGNKFWLVYTDVFSTVLERTLQARTPKSVRLNAQLKDIHQEKPTDSLNNINIEDNLSGQDAETATEEEVSRGACCKEGEKMDNFGLYTPDLQSRYAGLECYFLLQHTLRAYAPNPGSGVARWHGVPKLTGVVVTCDVKSNPRHGCWPTPRSLFMLAREYCIKSRLVNRAAVTMTTVSSDVDLTDGGHNAASIDRDYQGHITQIQIYTYNIMCGVRFFVITGLLNGEHETPLICVMVVSVVCPGRTQPMLTASSASKLMDRIWLLILTKVDIESAKASRLRKCKCYAGTIVCIGGGSLIQRGSSNYDGIRNISIHFAS
uniref:Uncharacterized protein n=1 Tax=Timema bartmani TaxID=61472 RepID=A0A7R9I0A9_9NEOP|nr:unnamed protein product [Timema bartmani]